MGHGDWCYPLTMSDAYSRFLLECRGLPNTRCQNARPWFERAFDEYGLPNAIRTDNGSPFVTTAGNFVSGWRLGTDQLQSVLSTGRLF
jgi:putative transposase